MIYKGKVLKFGDDVSTDAIIPGKYKFDTVDMDELAKHAMEGEDPNFYDKVDEGDIIVAGKNFGCGSSREQAPLVLKHSGVSCIVAESFARIFFRNAINVGLPIIKVPGISDKLEEEQSIRVDLQEGKVIRIEDGELYEGEKLSEFMMQVLNEGGLPQYINKRGGFE